MFALQVFNRQGGWLRLSPHGFDRNSSCADPG
jgi:hypothetical protein